MIRLAGLLAAALLLTGCDRVFGPAPQDDLSTWQRVPLAPDPGLGQAAANSPACTSGDANRIEIVLQDRRTASTAAFIVRGPNNAGACMYSANGGGGGGGGQPLAQLEPLVAAMSVDEDGSGGVGAGTATYLGGRVSPEVATVRIEVRDDLAFDASIGGGYWLGWWPDAGRAARVVALDTTGAELVSLTFGSDGWTAP